MTLPTATGTLLAWYHGSVPCQWDDLPHLSRPSPWTPDLLSCRAAGSGCSLALDSWHLLPRYAKSSLYSLQCSDAKQIIKNKGWFLRVIQTNFQAHKRSNFLIGRIFLKVSQDLEKCFLKMKTLVLHVLLYHSKCKPRNHWNSRNLIDQGVIALRFT